MSDCDGMSITIQNHAVDEDGNAVTAQIQGLNPHETSSLRGFSIGEEIAGNGGTASGTAYSGSGTKGSAEGVIEVALVWNRKSSSGVELLKLQYAGHPGNDFGWFGCRPSPTPNGTPNFYVTTATKSGKGSQCQQTFYLHSY